MAANQANYTAIGLTVVAGMLATIGTLVYLGGLDESEERVYAETYSEKSVSGLSVGSVVNFRGVKVGEVKEINFVGNKYPGVSTADERLIYILMSFRKKDLGFFSEKDDLPVKYGLRATVTASGITGLSRIELDVTSDGSHPDMPPWEPAHLYIPCAVSLLDNFSDSATRVMTQINRMDLMAVWSNVSSTVSSFATASDGVATLLESKRADFERMLDDLAETASSIKTASAELMRNPSLLLRERIPEPLDETE